ncbi:hypothetical protein [Deinococcus ficus]|uniref:Type IV secretion system protein n=1 Tax=Deinococcus ficus TaxID=317577 RepID=A0A221T2Y5_9DEIO|nr:hypothetical protein [Deinococcus ficus]ASN83287.1 hypothetical protein DFI_18995 [Deinococcus ficus]
MKLNFRTLLHLLLILVVFSGAADAVTLAPIKCNSTAPAPSNTADWLNINLESFIPNASCWMNNTYYAISTFGLFNIMAKFGTLVIVMFTFKAFFDGWTSRNWTGTLRVLFLSAIAVVLLNDAKQNGSITNRIYTIPVNLWRTIYKASSGMVQDSVKTNVVKNTQELATVTGAFVLHSMLATNSMITYNLDGKQAFQQGAAAAKEGELAGLTDAAANKAMGDIKDVNKELTEQVKKMSFIFQIGYLFLMGFFMAFAGIIYFSGLTIIICMFAFPLAVAFWAVGNSRPLTTIFNTVLVSLATVAIVPVVMAVAANLAIAQPTETIKTQMATANTQAGTVVKDYIAKSATCAAQAQAAGKAAPVGSQTVVNAMTNLKCETLDQITPIAKEFGASVFRITVAMIVMIMTMMMCIGIGVALMRHVPSLLSQIFQGGTVSADHNNVGAIATAGVAGAISGGQRAVGYTMAGAGMAVQGGRSLANGLNQAGAGAAAKGADALDGGSKNPKLGDGGAFALPSPAPTPMLPGGAGGAAAVNSTASNNATPAPSEQATNQAAGTTTQSSTSDALPGAAGVGLAGAAGQGAGQDAADGTVTAAGGENSSAITVTHQNGAADPDGLTGPATAAAEQTGAALDTASSGGQDIGLTTPTPDTTEPSAVDDPGAAQDVATSAAGDVTGDVLAPPAEQGGTDPAQAAESDAAPLSEAVSDGSQVTAAQENTASVTEVTGETVTLDAADASASDQQPNADLATPAAAAATATGVAGAAALNAAGLKAAGDPGSVAAGKYTQALKDQRAQQDRAAAARMSTTATGIIGLATREKLGLTASQSLAGGIVTQGLKHGTQGVRDTAAAGQRLAARGAAITPAALAAEKAAMRREGALPSQRQADAASVRAAAIAHNRAELAQAAKDPSHTPNLITPEQARHHLASTGQLPSQISADKARIDQVMADHKAAQAQLDVGERTSMTREEAHAHLAGQGQLSAQEYRAGAGAQPADEDDHLVHLHTPQTSSAPSEAADQDHASEQRSEQADPAAEERAQSDDGAVAPDDAKQATSTPGATGPVTADQDPQNGPDDRGAPLGSDQTPHPADAQVGHPDRSVPAQAPAASISSESADQDKRVPVMPVPSSQAVPVTAQSGQRVVADSAQGQRAERVTATRPATPPAQSARSPRAERARSNKGGRAPSPSAKQAGPLRLNKAGEAAVRGERPPAPKPHVGRYTAALQASRAKAQQQRDAGKPLTATRIIGMAVRDTQQRRNAASQGAATRPNRDQAEAARFGADYQQLRRGGGLPSQLQADQEAVLAVTHAHNTSENRRAIRAAEKGEVYAPQPVTPAQVRDHMAFTGTLPSHQSMNEARIEQRTAELAQQHAQAAANNPDLPQPNLDRDSVHRILEEEKALAHQEYQANRASAAAGDQRHEATPDVAQSVPTAEAVAAPEEREERTPVPSFTPEADPVPVAVPSRSAASPTPQVMHQEVEAQPHHLDVSNLQAGLNYTEDTPSPSAAEVDTDRPRKADRNDRTR